MADLRSLTNARGVPVVMKGLVKQFPGTAAPAVAGIDLDIDPGEFLTLLGPSGSGKTTTLNMVAGFESITSGSLFVDGVDYTTVPVHKREIGTVFQHYALFPHLTAAQNVAFPLRQRKMPREEIRTRVAAALAMVRLEGYADRYPSELSGGQQQRVAVARATVFGPRVLCMDEPLGALDKNLRDQMQSEIRRLHADLGLTFLLVTHDQEEAMSMSDRIAVFNQGRIEQVGSPEDLYERPSTRFVAEFMGASTILAGRFDAGRQVLSTKFFEVAVDRSSGSSTPATEDRHVAVRPERICVLPHGSTPRPGENALDAEVAEIVYLGVLRRVVVSFPWGGTGMVREPVHASSPVKVGDRVTITWPVEAGVLLDD